MTREHLIGCLLPFRMRLLTFWLRSYDSTLEESADAQYFTVMADEEQLSIVFAMFINPE